ncbi:pyridoxamine 5'-phosphate oxidase family protein [Streptosporangium sp. NBC_01756]|uniref:pyridoxamine 5'-phosphate oxidase family protein n=1 Tax=Streptosporangium sp. NBC_01756 TaxID=2975950 RepID=UPI002DDB7DCA|nr:pyridoxamine 5'-phosphate oxidase family protein [Streptosporangium sp. NBC_01756]WSC83998.1 pyridoxamine 5'-phosphate oxidase family protein [Streptosporangium sp. NBC_01756]
MGQYAPRGGLDDGEGLPGSRGEHVLQRLFATRERAERFYDRQVVDRLTPHMREFVARQEMVFVGTSDAAGNCDTSFRAGPPGFVRVMDDTRLMYPEFRGNGVLASMGNMLENAHISLLFVDFFEDLVGLHINGAATIVTAYDAVRRYGLEDEDRTVPGRRAERWITVEVEEAYIHCSKHIPLLVRQDRRERRSEGRRPAGDDYFGVGQVRSAGREREVAGKSVE